jgi:hypothetical protein
MNNFGAGGGGGIAPIRRLEGDALEHHGRGREHSMIHVV